MTKPALRALLGDVTRICVCISLSECVFNVWKRVDVRMVYFCIILRFVCNIFVFVVICFQRIHELLCLCLRAKVQEQRKKKS